MCKCVFICVCVLFSFVVLSVSAEEVLLPQMETAIDELQGHASGIFQNFGLLYGSALSLEDSLENVSCLMDPIFDTFDELLANYSNCGFLGGIYGGFKEVGCVTLFSDMYYITRAMSLIAFLSIVVVVCGFTTQFMWHPPKDEDDDDDLSNMGSIVTRQFSHKVMSTLSQRRLAGLDEDDGMDEFTRGDAAPAALFQPPPPSAAPIVMTEGATTHGSSFGSNIVQMVPVVQTVPMVQDFGTGQPQTQPTQAMSAAPGATGVPLDFEADRTHAGSVV